MFNRIADVEFQCSDERGHRISGVPYVWDATRSSNDQQAVYAVRLYAELELGIDVSGMPIIAVVTSPRPE